MAEPAKSDSKQPQDEKALRAIIAAERRKAAEAFGKIAGAEHAIQQMKDKKYKEGQRKQALILSLVPKVNDKKLLDGRAFEILFTNKISEKKAKALEAPGLEAARGLQAVFQDLGIKAAVTARVWGNMSATTEPVALDAPYAGKLSPCRSIDAPVAYLEKALGAEEEKGKTYIIVTGGVNAGDVEKLALKFADLLARDPAASVNFVVCGQNGEMPLDVLAEELADSPAAKQVNVIKVRDYSEVLDGVKSAIKARVAAEAGLPPPPKKIQKPGLLERILFWPDV